MVRIFLILFCLVSILDLGNVWFQLPYRQFTKSLIVPSLAIYFLLSTPKSKSYFIFLTALVFAWLGDVFLLFSGANYFLLGLGSFLIMQIIYSFVFAKSIDIKMPKTLITLILLIGFSLGFNYYLWPFVTEMRLPVIVYSLAIAMMAFTGMNRISTISGYQFIFCGVILFVISDTILAMNSFADGFWKGGFLVMLSYILAQYFIVEGYARHLRSLIK